MKTFNIQNNSRHNHVNNNHREDNPFPPPRRWRFPSVWHFPHFYYFHHFHPHHFQSFSIECPSSSRSLSIRSTKTLIDPSDSIHVADPKSGSTVRDSPARPLDRSTFWDFLLLFFYFLVVFLCLISKHIFASVWVCPLSLNPIQRWIQRRPLIHSSYGAESTDADVSIIIKIPRDCTVCPN